MTTDTAEIAENMQHIKPLGDRIVIRRDKAKTESSGKHGAKIILPDTGNATVNMGTVVAVGPGKRMADGTRATLDVQEGDRVLFQVFAVSKVEIDDQPFVMCHEEDILGVIKPGP